MSGLLSLYNRIMDKLRTIFLIRFTLDVFARFGRDNGGLLAAGLAFFMVLAFVPMLLVGLYVLGHIYADKPGEAVQQIQNLISTQILPGAASVEVNHLMARAGIIAAEGGPQSHDPGPALMNILHKRGIAGIVGVLSLAWAAMQIFINGSTAMNAAWETTEKRGWIQLRLVALALLVFAGVLVILSLASTGWSTRISASSFAHLVPFEGAALSLLWELVAVVVSAVMYGVIYKFLPSAHVSWKSAFVGGAASAIAWEVVKKGLAVYLLHPNKSLYGELGGLIIFVLLVYYSMMILLLGAEASAVYSDEVEKRPLARLKRAKLATPAADSSSSSGSPLAHPKDTHRAPRPRKPAPRQGQQARR